jgi:hypothetical protein
VTNKENFDEIQIDKSFIEITDNPKSIYEQISNVFKSSSHYRSLERVCNVKNRLEFYTYYVNDYIILARRNILNKIHFDIVRKRVRQHILTYYTKKFDDFDILVALHLSFKDLQKELELLLEFIEIEPEIATTLAKNDSYDLNLCFLASKILCKKFTNLSPGMVQSNWKTWLENISKTAYLIDDFIQNFITSLKHGMNKLDIERHQVSIKEFKSLWEREITLKLFIENVCKDADKLFKHCIRLWNLLKDPIDFKKQKSISELINFLNIIIKAAKTQYTSQLKKCSGCNEIILDGPRKHSDCKDCVLCNKCILQLKNTKRCPGCSLMVKEDDKLIIIPVKGLENIKEEYLTFKSNCEIFFLDIVSTLSLNDDLLPEKEVIEILIDQVMPKQAQNEENDLDFNLNPTIKSTLLQLLLNYKSNEVENVLDSLFSKSADFLKSKYNYQDIMELNLMYINAIEDSLYSTATDDEKNSNLNADAELAIELLKKLTELVYMKKLDMLNQISQLRTIAEIRFCLVTCSRFVNEFNLNNSLHKKLMTHAMNFIEIYPSEWPKYFILKQVFRRYGKSVLTSTNQFKELKWIIPEYLVNDLTNVY